ncbi:unnamed protein product [Orchesella dallaii]|uniref:G-protein coupled receptors family 2 profile 2 domain-containing protein n=1 Tax=Orchesella dallaii TaxID=48710 RepID=A0ABP1QHT2_9HEXA
MESILVILISVLVLSTETLQNSTIFNNTADRNQSSPLFYDSENATESSGNDEIDLEFDIKPSMLELHKCPGSELDVDVVHNLSDINVRAGQPNAGMMIKLIGERHPDCGDDSLFESTNFLVSAASLNESDKWNRSHSLYAHGWLYKWYDDVKIGEYEEEYVPPNRFCVDRLNDAEFTVKFCRTNCLKEHCLPKCCESHEVCDLEKSQDSCQCASSGPTMWTNVSDIASEKHYAFVYQHFTCSMERGEINYFTVNKNGSNLTSLFQNELRIVNGTVQLRRQHDNVWLDPTEGLYCVDGAQYLSPFSGDSSDISLFMCVTDAGPPEPERQDYILFRILVPFSIVFLVLTIIIYCLTWKEQNVHGYTVFSYLVTLLALYVSIVLSTIQSLAHPFIHRKFCKVIAGVIHFSYLSSMCWLTCVSFDLWRQFRKMNCPTYKSRGKRKFALFFMFSIGYPAIKVTMCAMLDSMYRNSKILPPLPLPAYGTLICSMSNTDGITYYLYIPISVLLAFNTAFFVATIITMIQRKKSIRDAFNGISNNTSTKVDQSFGIYARLFVIMGIFWVSQIICWFVLPQSTPAAAGGELSTLDTIRAVVDALTVLQAVVIFYIFVCKRSVYVSLWNLQPWLQCILHLY